VTSGAARPFRRVCVFCGASAGRRPAYRAAAATLGRELARRGIGVVTGGGRVGLMGEIADASLGAGGEVIGVIPQGLVDREVAHTALTELRVVSGLHERKAGMAAIADAFVALPGGLGTLEELSEVASWAQLGLHSKPIGLLDVEGYFRSLLAYLDHAAEEGFLAPEHRAMLVVHDDPGTLLDLLAERPAPPDRWAAAAGAPDG
jgi:uncharacterized protein (TIGR00730 family)